MGHDYANLLLKRFNGEQEPATGHSVMLTHIYEKSEEESSYFHGCSQQIIVVLGNRATTNLGPSSDRVSIHVWVNN